MMNLESPVAEIVKKPTSFRTDSVRYQTELRTIGFACVATLLLLLSLACNPSKGGPGVMATVNGHKIDRAEVDKYYNNQIAGAAQKPSQEQADSLRLTVLKQLIDNELLMQRAEKLGLLATDDEVNSKLAEFKAPYTQEEFDKRLKAQGITLDDLKRDLRRSITVDKVLNKEVTSKINITDADISSYYEEHKAEFNLVETRYRLAQILVTTEPNPQMKLPNKAQNEADARKKIQTAENRLDSGEDFSSVAVAYSEQPDTAQTGGDLGFIPESSLKGDAAAYDADQQIEARPIHAGPADRRSLESSRRGLSHRQAPWQGSRRSARTERSPRAAGDP